MVQVPALTHAQLEARGVECEDHVRSAISATLNEVAGQLHGMITLDDLGPITRVWNKHVDRLTDFIGDSYDLGVYTARKGQRDALVAVLGRRSSLTAAASPGDFEVPKVESRQAKELLESARNRLSAVGDDVWQAARAQLIEGMHAGEGADALRDRVRNATDFALPRAGVVARTEVSHAMNQGALAQMQQLDVPTTKEWLAVNDSRTRPEHAEMDGEKVALDGTFSNGEDPGDEPNCRCTLGFEIADDNEFASSVCDCDDGELPLLASAALVASIDDSDLTSVCSCETTMSGDEVDQAALPGEDSHYVASHDEWQDTRRRAAEKMHAAPVPSEEAVTKAQQELANARAGLGRAGGESRGGSAAARRKQRFNLFKEFGGEDKGYVVCHGCGTKIHWADAGSPENPHGFARFERGKIFVKCQGGGYQLANLLPECFSCNRTRGDKTLRDENRC